MKLSNKINFVGLLCLCSVLILGVTIAVFDAAITYDVYAYIKSSHWVGFFLGFLALTFFLCGICLIFPSWKYISQNYDGLKRILLLYVLVIFHVFSGYYIYNFMIKK